MSEGKVKILWVSDGEAPTGFARVAHNLIENLSSKKYEVHHLAINYRGDPHNNWWKLYPAGTGGDLWGFGRFVHLIHALQPHVIFLLNDPWVIQQYLAKIVQAKGQVPGIENIPVVVYFPVDAREHDLLWFKDYAELVKKVCVYTEFGRDVILETGGVNPTRIELLPHGANLDIFYKLTDVVQNEKVVKTGKRLARESIFPVKEKPELLDSFIILNANRNQPRKRIDITLRAFAEFARGKPNNVKLYLHMGTKDMGWDIIRLAQRYGFDERLVITSIGQHLPHVPDDRLNLIYNACDVGLNTGLGEGWGLTSWEHGAIGAPQIVPDHSVFSEIWGDAAIYVPTIADFVYEATNTVARVPSTDGVVEKLEWAYQDWKTGSKELKVLGKKAIEITHKPEYQWKNIAEKLDVIFDEVKGANVNILAG
jgi:glycosyltransferase involved in cell wall biosynthesis